MAKTKKKRGLSPATSSGLNKKNYQQRGGGNRVSWKEGETIPLQFFTKPKDFVEFDMHQFKEGKTWASIPCAGDDCPLCEDDDDDISKTRYQFCAPVYNLKAKKSMVLRGGKDLAGKIMLRYDKMKEKGQTDRFTKTVWDITQMPGQFITYDVSRADDSPKKMSTYEPVDLDKWLTSQMQEYFGNDMPGSAMDDDDDDDEPKKKKKKRR